MVSRFMDCEVVRSESLLRPWSMLLLVIAMTGGCQTQHPSQGLLEESVADAKLSSQQLRVMVNEFVMLYAIDVEQTCDTILAETTDPRIRKNALLWKSNGIASMFRAAQRHDSLAAFLDAWILVRQTSDLLREPHGEPEFGPWQSFALERSLEQEVLLREIETAIGTEFPEGEEEDWVIEFAMDFPIKDLYFKRKSISSEYLERIPEKTQEMFEILGRLDANIEEMQVLLSVYAEHLPKLARWQAELLMIEATGDANVARTLQGVDVAANSVARMAGTVEILPSVVEHERRAVEQIVNQQRHASFAQIEQMRLDTLRQIQFEREEILAALRSERNVVTQELSTEVAHALAETDKISRQRTEEVAGHGHRMLDRVFSNLWLLFGSLSTGMVGLTFVGWLAWTFTRRRHERDAAQAGSYRLFADETDTPLDDELRAA